MCPVAGNRSIYSIGHMARITTLVSRTALLAPRAPSLSTTATTRLSGSPWQRIRERILKRDPCCMLCRLKGIIRESVQVDHKVPLHDGGSNGDDNLQGICLECHRIKTASEGSARFIY